MAACLEPGEYLLIEDTTLLDYSPHRATPAWASLGMVGAGLCLHSTLAMKVMAWDLEQNPKRWSWAYWASNAGRKRRRPAGGTRSSRMWREHREFQAVGRSAEDGAGPVAGSLWTYVADREADFYEPIQ